MINKNLKNLINQLMQEKWNYLKNHHQKIQYIKKYLNKCHKKKKKNKRKKKKGNFKKKEKLKSKNKRKKNGMNL